MKKITLTITDLHCPSCVMRLEGLEDDLEGVSAVRASYQKQTMEVTYDEGVLNTEKIIDAIRAIGYTPAPLP